MAYFDDNLLLELGISKSEAKVYYALIELGSCPASEIALKAGIHRVNVYDALNRLKDKGLVATITRDEKSYFEPASPEEIEKLISRKKESLEKINLLLPKLNEIYNQEKSKQAVHHFMGKNGVMAIYNHIIQVLPKGGEFISFGTTGIMRDYFPEFIGQLLRRMKEKSITAKTIYYHSAKKTKKFKDMNVRYFPKDVEAMPMTFYLYDGWVAIINFEPMLGIEIQSDQIYNNFKSYADWLWSISEE